MATKKGSWKSQEISSFDDSNNGTWRAQAVIAPDGSKFLGVRRFVTKKDGTEVMTSTGFLISYGENTRKTLDGLSDLLKEMKAFLKERGK